MVLVASRRADSRRRLPRARRPRLPQDDSATEPLRPREPSAARGGRRCPPAGLVLALLEEHGDRRRDHRAPVDLARELRAADPGPATARDLPLLLDHELRDPLWAAADHEPHADPGLRAGRRGMGRQARRRSRPGGGEGRSPARRRDLAIGRGIRARGRQARARAPFPRRAGHREDDAGEGARDRVQLPVRIDSGLGLRGDLHRHRRDRRARARPPREAARKEVGRAVHRLHRRDRRRRDAPERAEPRFRRRRRSLRPGQRARAPLVRAERRPQPVGRPHPGEPPVAGAALRRACAAVPGRPACTRA